MFMELELTPLAATTLAGFARYLRDVRGRSAATAESYSRDASTYLCYLERKQLKPADGLVPVQAGLYLMERMSIAPGQPGQPPPLSARSAARAVSALKAFAAYLVFTGDLAANPLENLHPPKYGTKLPVYYSVEEILRLLAARRPPETPAEWRDAAILHVLYGCGLRVSECAGLELDGLNLAAGWASVQGKGGKQRLVPLSGKVAAAVRNWLEQGRPRWATERSGAALFLGRRGKRIARRAIQRLLDQAALEAGMQKPVSPHKLRHACATHLLEGGADVRSVQELLGHEKLGTTQVYTQITRTHLRDVYLEAHPRAKLPPGRE
jgi:integrase/recombinase XerD